MCMYGVCVHVFPGRLWWTSELQRWGPLGGPRCDQLRVFCWMQCHQEAHRLHPRLRLHRLDERGQYRDI